jgi:hypothetical protein
MAGGFTQGLVAGADAAGTRYRYDAFVRIQLDASPFAGKWTPLGVYASGTFGIPVVNALAGAETYITGYSTDSIVMAYNINAILRESLTDSPGVLSKFQKLHLRYFRAAAGDVLSLVLYSSPKAGGAVATAEASWSNAAEFTTTGAWTQFDDAADQDIDFDFEAKTYWLILLATNSTGIANVRVGTLLLDIDKLVVE